MRKIILVLIGISLSNCNNRTSSIDRFSQNMDITIPENVIVTKDEYQDMLQDFVIFYELKLTEATNESLVNSIKKSHFYNSDLNTKDTTLEENYIKFNEVEGIWKKTLEGYEFKTEFGRHIYTAKIDTIKLIAKFQESYD